MRIFLNDETVDEALKIATYKDGSKVQKTYENPLKWPGQAYGEAGFKQFCEAERLKYTWDNPLRRGKNQADKGWDFLLFGGQTGASIRTDIKCSCRLTDTLLIIPRYQSIKNKCEIYVSIKTDLDKVADINGWVTRYELPKFEDTISDLGDRGFPAYNIPINKLTPIEELIPRLQKIQEEPVW